MKASLDLGVAAYLPFARSAARVREARGVAIADFVSAASIASALYRESYTVARPTVHRHFEGGADPADVESFQISLVRAGDARQIAYAAYVRLLAREATESAVASAAKALVQMVDNKH